MSDAPIPDQTTKAVCSTAWLERLRGHSFFPGEDSSCGDCEECGREVMAADGYYRRTSYEYDECQCLCRECVTEKMDDDEKMWASYGDPEEVKKFDAEMEAAWEREEGLRRSN